MLGMKDWVTYQSEREKDMEMIWLTKVISLISLNLSSYSVALQD